MVSSLYPGRCRPIGCYQGHPKTQTDTCASSLTRTTIVPFKVELVLLVSVVEASGQKAPSAKPFERLDGCVLEPDKWTDGDSFRVRLPNGRLETFPLYFVDTTESRSRGKRSDEQAAYFGLTRAGAIKLGEEAKAFTAAALQKPFTIQTRWR